MTDKSSFRFLSPSNHFYESWLALKLPGVITPKEKNDNEEKYSPNLCCPGAVIGLNKLLWTNMSGVQVNQIILTGAAKR